MIRCETCLVALQIADRKDNNCPACKDYKGKVKIMSKLDTLNEHNPWQVGLEFMKLEETLDKVIEYLENNLDGSESFDVQEDSAKLLSWIKNWKGEKL